MPYFLTPEVWTQVKEPPKVIANLYSHMPGPAYCEGQQVIFRQTTLNQGGRDVGQGGLLSPRILSMPTKTPQRCR